MLRILILGCLLLLSPQRGYAERGALPPGYIHITSQTVVCNTSEQQSELWTARKNSYDAYKAAYLAQSEYGCIELREIDARPIALVATYAYDAEDGPYTVAVFQIKTLGGGDAYLAKAKKGRESTASL